MNLEDLSKSQLVLLTLLISFVSSVATGIITASLLNEAPVSVTQIIDRVVERTVEKVVPDTTVREVLNDEDRALLAVVDQAARNVIEIEAREETGTSTTSFLGVIVTRDGIVVSSLGNVRDGASYTAILADKTRLPLALSATSTAEDIAIFKFAEADGGNTAE